MKQYIVFFFFLLSFIGKCQTNQFLIPYRDGDLWGLSDTLGNLKIKPFAKEISQFSIGRNKSKYLIKKDNKISLVDVQLNNLLYDSKYDSLVFAEDDEGILVYKDGKMGAYLDNKLIIPVEYNKILQTYNNSFIIQKEETKGLINSKGNLIIPMEYKHIHPSYEDNEDGNPDFYWIAEGMLVKKKFMDNRVSVSVSPIIYTLGMKEMSGGTYEEIMERRDRTRNELLKIYDDVSIFRDDKNAKVKINGKYGIYSIDSKREIIKPKYDEIEEIGYDRQKLTFIVKSGDKFGIIQEMDKILIPVEMDKIEYKSHGVYFITKKDLKGIYIKNTVYENILPKYLDIQQLDPISINDGWSFGIFKVKSQNNKIGYIGENGVEYFKN